MKRFILIFSLFLCISAQAQTDSTVRAKIRANLPDNITRSITPLLMRNTLNFMMDYILKYTDVMTVGTGGKSFSIKPKGVGTGLGTPPPAEPKDLFVDFVARSEDSLKTLDLYGRRVPVQYLGKQVFTRSYEVNAPTVETQLITGIDDLIELESFANYINSASREKTIERNGLARFDSDTHKITIDDYECTGCTQKKIFLTILYTKE